MKDLLTLNDQELIRFFNSFDIIFCDVHGVLCNASETISGSPEAIACLQKIGKRVVVVSNNSIESEHEFKKILQRANYNFSEGDIVTPISTQIHYLKSQNFSKKIFVLGSEGQRNALREAGFEVLSPGPFEIEESFKGLAEATLVNDDVGAVIVDTYPNVNYANLEIAHHFLQNPNVLFLKGAPDAKIVVGEDRIILGPGEFQQLLERATGREAVSTAKPSHYLNEYIVQKFKIKDPSRILFIGDSITSDIAFGRSFGYQTLLVFSGFTKKGCLENWQYPIKHKPDFYLDSLKSLHILVTKIFG